MKIAQLTLKTHTLDSLREFYADHLGFNLLEETDESFTLDAGESRLTFVADDEEEAYQYHFAFNIPYNQMMDAELWLTQRVNLLIPQGAKDAWVEHLHWQAEALYFTDPAGNVVEFIGRQRLSDDTAIPFSAQSIQSISEIGLAVADVDREIATIRFVAELDLPDFGEGSADFRAVGDDDGLLIFVRTGRIWFPTRDAAARVYPVSMTVHGETPETLVFGQYPYRIRVLPSV